MNYLPDKETTFEKKVQTAKENYSRKLYLMKNVFFVSSSLLRRKTNIVYVPELIASSSLLKMTLILSIEFFTVHWAKIKYHVNIVT